MSIPQAQHVSHPRTGQENQSSNFTAIDIPVDSPKPKTPSLDLLEHRNRKLYLEICVPLYKHALKGDWEAAERILLKDQKLLNASISRGLGTVLHVAAGARHFHFVEKLVDMMDKEDLALQDKNGNTALCIAAAGGFLEIVQLLIEKNNSLLTIRGGAKMAPPYMAAVLGQSEMAWHLYSKSKKMMEKTDLECLFFSSIDSGLYDIALQLLDWNPDSASALAKARTDRPKNKTALHILARRPSVFGSQSPGMWGRLINSFLPGVQFPFQRKLSQADVALQLVQRLWEEILKDEHENVMNMIRYPSNLLFDAVEVGNYEFLAALMSSYPELVWETDEKNRTIIHIAVLHRHDSIFNLVHEIGSIKDVIVTYEDDEGNNIVHIAAKLAPQNQLNVESSAHQMHRELVWFEEVKKMVQPRYIEMKNYIGKTPQDLFTEEHRELVGRAELWMKDTATSFLLVATIIATVAFTAAFSMPGGTDDHTGKPNFIKEKIFPYFIIADGVALFSSATAMLMFLVIFTSRYTENDFLKSLPLKLAIGFTFLFISIASMMMTFSTAFYFYCQYELKWVSVVAFIFAFVPVALFAFMQFEPCKRMIYSKVG